MKYLYVGRFQPFHLGHKAVIDNYIKTHKNIDNLTIFIGSSNVKNKKNPYTYEQRKEFIDSVYGENVLQIHSLPDVNNDVLWIKSIASILKEEYNYSMSSDNVIFLAGTLGDLCKEQLKYTVDIFDRVRNGSNISGTCIREILEDDTISVDKKRQIMLDYVHVNVLDQIL